MSPSSPTSDAPSASRRPSSAVTALSILSTVLAIALVAVSLAWWTGRDDEQAAAEEPAAAADEPENRDVVADDGAASGGSDSDGRWHPGDRSADPGGSEPSNGADRRGGANPVEDALDRLLGGSSGGALDQLSGISPECLDGSVWDLLGGLGGAGGDLDGSLADQVRQIAESVAEQRGLDFTEPVEPTLVPADEFDQQVAELFTEEYTADDADLDSRILSLLGAIPAGTDLRAAQIDLLSGQVAGYYDPETGEIVVRDDGDGELDANERMTLAHELDHALTDQALGLPDTEVDGRTDADLAGLALVEGDATLLMQQWALANVGLADQLGQAFDPQVAEAQAELDDIAPYLREELMFPYLSGLSYACRLFTDGEWPAVDAAYADLPETTAEVIVEDWADGELVDPADPAALGGPWTEARRDTIGTAQLLWLFGAPGGSEDAALPEARELASRWAGGETVLSTDGDRSAMAVSLVDRADGYALCDAVDRWYDASFDDDERAVDGAVVTFEASDRVAALACDGRDVRLGIGPDMATALTLIG